MKTLRLNEFWTQRLAQLPESGMGYQRVDITLKDHRVIQNVIVFNAEECQTDEEFRTTDIVDIRIHTTKE
jgi:hypothetical protein